MDEVGLSAIAAVYEADDRDQPLAHAAMITKLLVYGHCVGLFSSRKIASRLTEDVAFRILAAGNAPALGTITDIKEIRHEVL